jgi:hypothetical protein
MQTAALHSGGAASASEAAASCWSLTPTERMGVLLHWTTRGPGRCEQTAAYEATLPTAEELCCGVLMTEAGLDITFHVTLQSKTHSI